MCDPMIFYSPETLLFPGIAERFGKTGELKAIELYIILDWKASRARTNHCRRLSDIAGSFEAAAQMLAAELFVAANPEQRLDALLTKWKFLLPTATALLAVLYPDTFTIYDIRVCNALGKFHKLGDTKWSHEVWKEYERYIAAVRAEAPGGLSLRDCDRWLWGRDKKNDMMSEINGTIKARKNKRDAAKTTPREETPD